jgi:hypothetical protein
LVDEDRDEGALGDGAGEGFIEGALDCVSKWIGGENVRGEKELLWEWLGK